MFHNLYIYKGYVPMWIDYTWETLAHPATVSANIHLDDSNGPFY